MAAGSHLPLHVPSLPHPLRGASSSEKHFFLVLTQNVITVKRWGQQGERAPRSLNRSLTSVPCASFPDHLPDHPTEPDTMADGAQDLAACDPTGRVSQVCRQELPGAG